MTRTLWCLFQAAIMVGVLALTLTIEQEEGRSLGYAPAVMAVGLAWLATIIPFAIIEGVKDVRRIYLPAFRRWRNRKLQRTRCRSAGSKADEPADELGRPGLVRLRRQLPKHPGVSRIGREV
jgi:hypothetical protein